MTGNSSSPNESISSYAHCLVSKPSAFIYTAFILINVFLFLPLFIFILYSALQRWRKKRSNPSASTVSNSDCFTFHLVVMELVGVAGCIISFGGICSEETTFVKVGSTLFSFTWYGEGFFQILTCVEHYLAVVHPITYLTLRKEKGLRIRNVTVGCVWLLSSVGLALAVKDNYIIMDSCVIILTVSVTPFCSLSVLRVLNHSGPGERDPSKQRAFYTIVAILLVLLLRLAWSVVWIVNLLRAYINCVLMTCEVLFNIPSNLVLPLLFLQRAGRLVCWKNHDEDQD